ncbi:class II aldolase/adducin family protein [Rhodosalinus sp.]|uniref:class II aldolase/adducin family protein n=1 Tax=Rhodosalinus sp. TaxID=2047741 RepID=UPI00397CE056
MALVEAGLVILTWGNASGIDRDAGVVAIKPSGVDYADLSPGNMVLVDLQTGETVEGAVRREVAEETGVRVGRVEYLASQPWPFPASLMLGCHGEALSEEITLDPVELDDALWIGRSELLEVFADAHPRIRAPRDGAIAGFLLRHWLADRLD